MRHVESEIVFQGLSVQPDRIQRLMDALLQERQDVATVVCPDGYGQRIPPLVRDRSFQQSLKIDYGVVVSSQLRRGQTVIPQQRRRHRVERHRSSRWVHHPVEDSIGVLVPALLERREGIGEYDQHTIHHTDAHRLWGLHGTQNPQVDKWVDQECLPCHPLGFLEHGLPLVGNLALGHLLSQLGAPTVREDPQREPSCREARLNGDGQTEGAFRVVVTLLAPVSERDIVEGLRVVRVLPRHRLEIRQTGRELDVLGAQRDRLREHQEWCEQHVSRAHQGHSGTESANMAEARDRVNISAMGGHVLTSGKV